MEIGITGGVEDGVDNSGAAKATAYLPPVLPGLLSLSVILP